MRPIHLLLAISASLLLSSPAKTHTHVEPDGSTVTWYPKECCHDRDCRPVATVQITKQGLWMTTVDGMTVLVAADEERRPSRDMRWHICLGVDDFDHNTVIRCVFEPPSTKHLRDDGKVAMP